MTDIDAIEILLVEDDQGDVHLMREILKDRKFMINMNVVEDGERAMQYLRREAPYTQAKRPDCVLLDMNLPKMDGKQVLAAIKKDPALMAIPVIVLTSSSSDEDVLRSYGLGANCYVTKPVGVEQFEKVVRSIQDFWFTIVRLPQGARSASGGPK